MRQSPESVVMVRPHAFGVNPETAGDNAFQSSGPYDKGAIARAALQEHDAVVAALNAAGVVVHVFEDSGVNDTPDSLFPNNWISADGQGRIVLYPMYTPNRRRERRSDIIDYLRSHYRVEGVEDWTAEEGEGRILEGTGSIVIDHPERIAYAARSQRTNAALFEKWCAAFGYRPVVFDAVDETGTAIYHTNVVMSVCTGFALLGTQCIPNENERSAVKEALRDGDHDIIELTQEQIANFAGNCLEVMGKDGPLLAISARALKALRPEQVRAIKSHMPILPLTIPTIEMAGGSVRCLMADIHLPPKTT